MHKEDDIKDTTCLMHANVGKRGSNTCVHRERTRYCSKEASSGEWFDEPGKPAALSEAFVCLLS